MKRKMHNAYIIDLRQEVHTVEKIFDILEINNSMSNIKNKAIVVRLPENKFIVVQFIGAIENLRLRKLNRLSALLEKTEHKVGYIVHPESEKLSQIEALVDFESANKIKMPFYLPTLEEKMKAKLAGVNECVIVDNANINEVVKIKTESGKIIELTDPYIIVESGSYMLYIGTKEEASEYLNKLKKAGSKSVEMIEAPLNQNFIDEIVEKPELIGGFLYAKKKIESI